MPKRNPSGLPGILLENRIAEPKMFKVLLHNDHYTTQEFVIEILMKIFNKDSNEAITIMLAVHEKGIASCGIYTFEIAETKVELVHYQARTAGFPLRCTLEEA